MLPTNREKALNALSAPGRQAASVIGLKPRHNAAFRIVDEAASVHAMTAEIHQSPPSATDIRTVNAGAQTKAG